MRSIKCNSILFILFMQACFCFFKILIQAARYIVYYNSRALRPTCDQIIRLDDSVRVT